MAQVPIVMVSSTFRDLKAEREGVREVIQGQGMLARMMETDSAIPDRGLLTNSRAMVQQAELYLLLVSNYRYGQVIEDAELNPKRLSITEREFEWAEERGLPMFVFLLDEDVSPTGTPAELAKDFSELPKLQAFRTRARHQSRIVATFRTVAELREKATKALSDWRLGQAPTQGTARPDRDPPDTPTVPLPDRCFGRTEDTAKLVAALCAATAPTAVLVQGPGGIGKTTLTQEAANHPEILARFGPRRWFVPLETAADRDTFDAALLTAIGLDPTAGFSSAPRRLAQAPTLLVLDNFETPWERAGPAIEARLGELAAIPGLALLTSFRGQEAVGGVRWSLRHPVDKLPDDEACALFRDIADTIAADDPHLPELLDALGGVPLAISLTARRAARHTDLAALWAEWQRVGVELAQWQGTDPSRLTSVAHSIELSLRSPRLPASGHRLFAILGQLPAGLAPTDRDALLGDEAFVAEDGLLAVGLAMHRAARLDLLPPVRDHARRAHPPKGEDATAWCRHFLTLTREQAGRIGLPGGPEALTQLAPEVANLEAAMRAAAGLSLREVAVAAAHGTYLLLSASGAGSIDALRALSQECHIAKDTRGEAGCCFYAGVVAFTRSDHASARALFVRAIPLFQQVGDLGDEADCIRRLGDVAVAREEYSEAQAFFEQSRTLSQKIGDELGEVNCVQSLGEIALRRTDDVAARILFEQALPSYRQLGDVVGEAICIARLGTIALRRADYAGARALYEQGRRLFQQVGDVQGEAGCLLLLGRVARSDGDPAAARTYATRALTIYERLQASQNVAIAHEDLARVTTAAEHAGHVAAARAAWSSIDLPDKAARVDREFG